MPTVHTWGASRPAPPHAEPAAFLRTPEVARKLGISTKRVRLLLRQGKLPGVRVGSVWYVPREALDAFLRHLVAQAQHNVINRLQEK